MSKKTLDYESFGSGKPPAARYEDMSPQWWAVSGLDAVNAISKTLETMAGAQKTRLAQYIQSSRLYGNLPISGIAGMSFSKLSAAYPSLRDRITYNAIQVAVDTAVSKVRKNRPKPYFLTSGGDYKQQRKAKKLNKFVDGVFYECRMNERGPEVFRDGAVWGTGILHVFARDGRVCFERVMPHEIWVDEVEAFACAPRQMHRVKPVDRAVLATAFPEYEKDILGADRARTEDLSTHGTVGDMVNVRESWHLPSGPRAEDGKHIISLGNVILTPEDEQAWEHDWVPFAAFHWSKRLFGFWGQGGVEQSQNTQLEINQLMWVAQRSYKLAGSFKILLENGSKVIKEHLNNDIGSVVTYSGTKPEYVVPPVVPGGLFEQIATHKQSIFEIFGVSTMAARSEKPAGLNSGIALREYKDETADRLLTPSQSYDQFHLDVARLAIETVKEIGKGRRSYSVRVPGAVFMDTVDWKSIDLDEDQYTLQCYPVSSLPSDPAGRLQTIQEFIQAGFLTARQGRRLMDFPDLEKEAVLHNAAEEYLQSILDKIVDDGEYTPPEPFDDLQTALAMALEYYQQGKYQNMEEAKLDDLRKFIDQVKVLQQAANPPAPMPAPEQVAPVAPPQPMQSSSHTTNAAQLEVTHA